MPGADSETPFIPPEEVQPARKPSNAERLDELERRVAALEQRNTDIDARSEETLQRLRMAAARQAVARPDVQEQLASALLQVVPQS